MQFRYWTCCRAVPDRSRPKVLAGSFARRPVRTGSVVSQCWVLPGGLTHPAEWIEEAWRQWNVIAPERFPLATGWATEGPVGDTGTGHERGGDRTACE